MQYVKPSELTKDNYYTALASVQNAECNVNQDIVTFTAFLDWTERIAHYTRYYNRAMGLE